MTRVKEGERHEDMATKASVAKTWLPRQGHEGTYLALRGPLNYIHQPG